MFFFTIVNFVKGYPWLQLYTYVINKNDWRISISRAVGFPLYYLEILCLLEAEDPQKIFSIFSIFVTELEHGRKMRHEAQQLHAG